MQKKEVQIHDSWYQVLENELNKPYFQYIKTFLKGEISSGKTIYPPAPLLFNAFNSTPFDNVKVVIIGQDPYHQAGQAMGLSFSVPQGVRIPPSLLNIFKEINRDLGLPITQHGDLTSWADQGVFLLNAMLSVEHNRPGSHKAIGWQEFTNAVIQILSQKRKHLVFMLWGNFAKEKKKFIANNEHLILEAAHPSPLAGKAFQNCKHFSKANDFFVRNGMSPIDWSLTKQ